MSTRKGGLGRGLGALIPTSEPVQLTKSVSGVEVEVANLKEVLISQISPNPRQPRTVFDEEALKKDSLDVVMVREPGGTELGENIRDLLLRKKTLEMSGLSETSK